MTTLTQSIAEIQSNITVLDTSEQQAVVCPDCEGTGYIRYDVAVNDPRFGRMYPCPNPECPVRYKHKHEQAARVMQLRSSWKEDYQLLTFPAFQALMNEDRWTGKRGAYAAAVAFATFDHIFTLNEAAQYALDIHWPKASNHSSASVALSGSVGIGKTGLAIAAANYLVEQGRVVIFIRLQDLIAHIQETYKRGWGDDQMESTEARLQTFIHVPYLIIDEFEVENYSDNRLENIEKIIRGRMDRPEALPTMITTNLTQDQFQECWGRRIADVVMKSHWVQMAGLKLRQTAPVVSEVW